MAHEERDSRTPTAQHDAQFTTANDYNLIPLENIHKRYKLYPIAWQNSTNAFKKCYLFPAVDSFQVLPVVGIYSNISFTRNTYGTHGRTHYTQAAATGPHLKCKSVVKILSKMSWHQAALYR